MFVPKFHPDDWEWDSYRWCDCEYKVPAINQCEVDKHKYEMSWGRIPSWLVKMGHGTKYCNCYTNKNSKYWKAKRK